jgi:ATP-binding cassette, subfamily B, bacterial
MYKLLLCIIVVAASCQMPRPKEDFPDYRERIPQECGPTCLKMIAKHYGISFSQSYLNRLCKMDSLNGTTMEGVSTAADSIGFKTMGVRVTYTNLRNEAPLPAIAHWNNNYFIVVYKIENDKIYIASPDSGKVVYTREDFLKHWQADPEHPGEGVLLLLEPKAGLQSAMKQKG